MKQWISVNDSLPGEGNAVLIYDAKCGVTAARMTRPCKRVWDQASQAPKIEPDTSQPPYWTDLEGELGDRVHCKGVKPFQIDDYLRLLERQSRLMRRLGIVKCSWGRKRVEI